LLSFHFVAEVASFSKAGMLLQVKNQVGAKVKNLSRLKVENQKILSFFHKSIIVAVKVLPL